MYDNRTPEERAEWAREQVAARREARRAIERRRRLVWRAELLRKSLLGLLILVALGVTGLVLKLGIGPLIDDDTTGTIRPPAVASPGPSPKAPDPVALPEPSSTAPVAPPADGYASRPAPAEQAFVADFAKRRTPRGVLVWNLGTGEVLYSRNATVRRPIASVTKIMTALVVHDQLSPTATVTISRKATKTGGSAVGVLPRGKRIGVQTMLYGLMLASGNDAAVALAERVSGNVRAFVRLMNTRARELDLRCTRFSTPNGLQDRGNYSCPRDLAILSRALMDVPRLRKIVGTRKVRRPFPIKGGRLELWNHNPLLQQRVRGTTGIKTGYTRAAGRSLVATMRRGDTELGVVLLHSPEPGAQAQRLLQRAFARLASVK